MRSRYRQMFDANIRALFQKALLFSLRQPSRTFFFVRILLDQLRCAHKRNKHLLSGLEVPPLLIISITRSCNLNCAGCYAKALRPTSEEELSPQRFRDILSEASELGISIILLAGGEPLLRLDLLEVAAEYPGIIFPVFTNGLQLDAKYIQFFHNHPHLIPVISLEGPEAETDARRGEGVYRHYQDVLPQLRESGIFWGVSFTVTSKNIALLLEESYLRSKLRKGCRLFFFVEYVPVSENSTDLVLSPAQKDILSRKTLQLTSALPGLFIAFPGNEEQYGGCLAAGRGFLHIDPSGKVEACPFAPFSDTDLGHSTLRQALSSPLMKTIREQHHLLKEGEGGCALWANRDLVQKLAAENKPQQ